MLPGGQAPVEHVPLMHVSPGAHGSGANVTQSAWHTRSCSPSHPPGSPGVHAHPGSPVDDVAVESGSAVALPVGVVAVADASLVGGVAVVSSLVAVVAGGSLVNVADVVDADAPASAGGSLQAASRHSSQGPAKRE